MKRLVVLLTSTAWAFFLSAVFSIRFIHVPWWKSSLIVALLTVPYDAILVSIPLIELVISRWSPHNPN